MQDGVSGKFDELHFLGGRMQFVGGQGQQNQILDIVAVSIGIRGPGSNTTG
jgi:hypothetical protein